MISTSRWLLLAILSLWSFLPLVCCAAPAAEVPEPLKAWEKWATWGDGHRACPTPYNDAKKHICFWPSLLALQVDAESGRLDLNVVVFNETWVPLPGSDEVWPLEVKANDAQLVVVKHDGRPSVRLAAGEYQISGTYRWTEIPPSIPLPSEIGILSLTLNGKPVETPAWDAQGVLWLKRDGAAKEADKDFLAIKVYSVIEDGIPLQLQTKVELIVAGKSREETLGTILPEGWKLSAVDSPIPVSVDGSGGLKAQVRAGKWMINLQAFRLDNPTEIQYAAGAKPAVEDEFVAFRARPDFRIVDITGLTAVDVSQTTFPQEWRDLPVYRWETATPFRIEERMRGMGLQKPAGLQISRMLWLDDDGRAFTFRDEIVGNKQQIWRLDAAPGQDLGSARSGGVGQLITRNPQTGAPGVEIRTRTINLEATGRIARAKELSATGWQAEAENLNVTLNLPPGWRLLALFGADHVEGDWLTSWTLLDLFLLLIFSFAVFRLWGTGAALLAFAAFGLSYHEPDAPRYVWLVLLIPLALLRVVPAGWGHRLLMAWKLVTVAALILILVPFLAQQIQQAVYPQLEKEGFFPSSPMAFSAREESAASSDEVKLYSGVKKSRAAAKKEGSNLNYDTKARIQTGPGVPDWRWRTVTFGWNGPVVATQQVHPVLIPLGVERCLTALRVVLLLALAGLLLNAKRLGGTLFRAGAKATVLLAFALCIGTASSAQAQFPDEAMLKTLRERLLKPSDAYPHAADIPSVSLKLAGHRITMEAEIHTAIQCAVPLPGRLPAWSPLSVLVDGKPHAALRRADGYLWIVLPEGVHRITVNGVLANVTEWEWTYALKPHRVLIDAPDWNVSGVRPNGVPEQQVFFTFKQKSTGTSASYDRQELQSVVVVDRNLELGLVWQVRTTVTRLSPVGKAIALRVPLLPGENVLSSHATAKDGVIEVRLGANDTTFTWESELTPTTSLRLSAKADVPWVERWHLVVSPIWNVAISGLAPVFEEGNPELVPVWHPWPGESTELAISRPEAVEGATVTVSKANHVITLGSRQRTSSLELSLRSSLGEDFLITLPSDAEVTSLTQHGKAIPVRKDGSKLIIPLRPGEQSLAVGWKTNTPLGFRTKVDEVRLPIESANIDTVVNVPDSRWLLWADGPLRGPAVRFWGVLACSLIAALLLGRVEKSPLRPVEWMLLMIGLTQIPLPAALAVVGWLFFLVWRGSDAFKGLAPVSYNFLQLSLIGLTAAVLVIFVVIVGAGLLGSPEMFISGNGSSRGLLQWYQARSGPELPRPGALSVSIWWYRLLMLAWALWLAVSLIRWLAWGWKQFSSGGWFRSMSKPQEAKKD